MKLGKHAFTTYWDLHAWAGMLAALLLHVMFFFGAVTLFHHHIGVWEEPRLHARPGPTTPGIDEVLAREVAAGTLPTAQLYLYLPEHGSPYKFGYTGGKGEWQARLVDPTSGALLKQRTALADFFYGLHYLWIGVPGYEWIYQIAGFLCVLLLAVIVSGVLIHVKDLARQLHQFRPEKKPRVFWSDLHKVFGVMGLPFQLIYGLSGAILCCYALIAGPFLAPLFAGDRGKLEKAAYGGGGDAAEAKPSGEQAVMLPVADVLARARAEISDLQPAYLVYKHVGDRAASVVVGGQRHGSFAYGEVHLSAITGEISQRGVSKNPPLNRIVQWLYGVHFVRYGGQPALWLHFVLALAGCFVMLSGNWVWLARREKTRESPGNRTLQRLTVGFSAGLCVAMAGLLVIHRFLPWDLAERVAREKLIFAGLFVAALAWALFARNALRLWWQQLGTAGLLFVAVTLSGGLAARPAVVWAVDLAFFAAGMLLLAGASLLRRREVTP